MVMALLAILAIGIDAAAKKTLVLKETPASDPRIEYTGRVAVEADGALPSNDFCVAPLSSSTM